MTATELHRALELRAALEPEPPAPPNTYRAGWTGAAAWLERHPFATADMLARAYPYGDASCR